MSTLSGFCATPAGFVVCVVIPIVAIAVVVLRVLMFRFRKRVAGSAAVLNHRDKLSDEEIEKLREEVTKRILADINP